MKFLKDHNPQARLLDDGRTWQLGEYTGLVLDNGTAIVAPTGYITDFASSPRWAWRIVPPFGTYLRAAICHDLLYESEIFPREECDHIFNEAMKLLNVPGWKRWAMYKAVRWGGGATWHKHTPESIAHGRAELLRGAEETGTTPPDIAATAAPE